MHLDTMMGEPGPKYGQRKNGNAKGMGYFGEMKRPDGMISTEREISVAIDGQEMEIPTLVPTLTREEVMVVLNGGMTKEIVDKSIDHAQYRMQMGYSPYAGDDEEIPSRSGSPWR